MRTIKVFKIARCHYAGTVALKAAISGVSFWWLWTITAKFGKGNRDEKWGCFFITGVL